MDVSKLENVCQIMRNYKYEIATDIDRNMLCLMCKNLLINARSAPCGCRFCFTCISGYLGRGNKFCPGDTEDCKLEILNLDGNIFVEYAINVRISKLKVKCPLMFCDYVDELRKMEEHSRTCKYRSVKCPYSNIGCSKCNISQDKVTDHLQSEIFVHTKLLLDFVGNFNNKMDKLKANNNELSTVNKLLQNEINELKLDGERRREEIAELQWKFDEKSVKIDQLNADIICLNGEKVAMRENMDKLISGGERNRVEIGDLQRKCADQVEEIELLNEDIPALRNVDRNVSDRLDGLQLIIEGNQLAIRSVENDFQQKIAQCTINCQQAEIKQKELIEKINQMENKQKVDLTEMSNKIDKLRGNVDTKLLEMAANQNQLNYGEFVWKLDKFTDKMANAKNGINTDIYSESFLTHKNGYKMCLRVFPNGNKDAKGTHLSVYFCLMKGECDSILEWPFRHSVTLALINQRTRLPHVSWTVKNEDIPNNKACIQPTDRNLGLGNPILISLKELSSNPDLMYNNQIFIKLSVDIRARQWNQ